MCMAYTWQYYDLVLVAIGASFLVGLIVGFVTALSVPVAVTGTSLVAAALVGHGLFVNGPVETPEDLTEPVDALN